MRWLGRAILVTTAMLVLGCNGGLSREALDWCGSNEAQVARVALDQGLMPHGAQFSDWKNSDSAGYEQACAAAYNAPR